MTYAQFGSGWSAPSGWRNFDASPTIRFERLPILGRLYTKNASRFPENVEYGDIVKGLPIRNGSLKGLYSSHVVEHLSREEAQLALYNSYMLLKPGGIFRVVVPDLRWRVIRYLAEEPGTDRLSADSFFDSINMGQRGPKTIKKILLSYLGHSDHLWMYDLSTMMEMLRRAGFSNTRECEFNDCEDAAFNLVEVYDRFYCDGHKEVCIEAKKGI